MTAIPGPQFVPRPTGMIPQIGALHRIDPEPVQTDQKILCAVCVSDGVYDPPAHVVIVDGSSMCLPHTTGTIPT